ncbi:matrix-remodeling-associated protein 7 isoform X2 [Hippocampus comes]|uniref:matrix-remodeling-associated protein 7 isoform X2 n=1 Tax=Hippocampus comes TaxID=109280 RepID=UPI00094F141A|nr:PREDICTED: matrix-remodeling-associated protein 7-like isoform X2 [Hippocampus comes]
MDWTFILFAVIFTLLALVVATSLLNGSSRSSSARSYPNGPIADAVRGGETEAKQNGHLSDNSNKGTAEEVAVGDDWCEMSGSSHDHWDVVKSVLSEEAETRPASEEPEAAAVAVTAPAELSSSSSAASSLSVPRPDSRHASFDSSSETDGDAESPDVNDKSEFHTNNSLKYVPGKSRSHHLEMMMSKDELEEEQRVQREQLAAIFQLLKDNTETFGEVSEGDMEEQLRLYSI